MMIFNSVALHSIASATAIPTVDLGTAVNYVILTRGVTNVPAAAITGDIVYPIVAAAMTGLGLNMDASTEAASRLRVPGKVKYESCRVLSQLF
jgi:hypothetical protein